MPVVGCAEIVAHIPLIEDHEDFLREIVVTVIMVRSDYHRRVYQPCASFPVLLLWFSHRGPDVKCPMRSKIAKQLLEMTEASLDSASLKVRQLFDKDLQYSAENEGEATRVFFLFMSDKHIGTVTYRQRPLNACHAKLVV